MEHVRSHVTVSVGHAVVLTLLVVAHAQSASATCMTTCSAQLVFDDCAKAPTGQWPVDDPLLFTMACETCCAAPGGPVNCSPSPIDVTQLSLSNGTTKVDGSFTVHPTLTCGDLKVITFDGTLALGNYELISTNLILVQFEAKTEVGDCALNTDCEACEVCTSGQCVADGKATCTDDADCGAGNVCVTDAKDACATLCKPESNACEKDDDCGACAVCVANECKGLGAVMCTSNSDCPLGEACVVDPIDACKNQCKAKTSQCTSSDQCGPCAVCVSGECKGTGGVMCSKDADCGAGMVCKTHPTDPCKNQCAAGPSGEDTGTGGTTGTADATTGGTTGDATGTADATTGDTTGTADAGTGGTTGGTGDATGLADGGASGGSSASTGGCAPARSRSSFGLLLLLALGASTLVARRVRSR